MHNAHTLNYSLISSPQQSGVASPVLQFYLILKVSLSQIISVLFFSKEFALSWLLTLCTFLRSLNITGHPLSVLLPTFTNLICVNFQAGGSDKVGLLNCFMYRTGNHQAVGVFCAFSNSCTFWERASVRAAEAVEV